MNISQRLKQTQEQEYHAIMRGDFVAAAFYSLKWSKLLAKIFEV